MESTTPQPPSTVADFSEQWTAYPEHAGFFGSEALLADVLWPLLALEDLHGLTVAEIGCGNGRYLQSLARHAERVIGVEPGDGIENARRHCEGQPNVELVRADVYALPPLPALDVVLCLGVLHHLPEPVRALRIMRALLRPTGRLVLWVYGREGNELYLAIFGRLRRVTTRLPHSALHALALVLAVGLRGYIALCRILPLPMRRYMRQVLSHLDFTALRINIYDQLNPTIASYWRRDEVMAMLRDAGFEDVRLHHRHGYSWTAVARPRPEAHAGTASA